MAEISLNYSKHIAMPFEGLDSINSLTRYDKYKDDKIRYDKKGNIFKNSIYLTGLEHFKGRYIQGATHGCLQLKDMEKCTPGVENKKANCVLINLSESDTVDCTEF